MRKAFKTATEASASHRVGVYDSGLTCRILREAGLVEFTWLADATGWRESATYQGWDVKQFVNDQPLCALEDQWQRCQARPAFGQFQPIGCAADGTEGEPLQVSATALNLRSVPTPPGNTPIAILPNRTHVLVLGPALPGWVRVRTVLNGATFVGYVNEQFLEPARTEEAISSALFKVPKVHWKENDPGAKRSSTRGLASPTGELPRRVRDPAADATTRASQLTTLTTIGDWLDVERSARYAKRDGKTFCNGCAADYCYLANVYLPRVWWTESALVKWAAGDTVTPVYGDTIREMRADDLYRWLLDFGASINRRRVSSLDELQSIANAGGVELVCADREQAGKPGHSTVVVPETARHAATRGGAGNVHQPLQS